MRITSSQLRQIIKEELLREGMNRLSGPQYMSKFIGLVQYQLKYIREFEIMATGLIDIIRSSGATQQVSAYAMDTDMGLVYVGWADDTGKYGRKAVSISELAAFNSGNSTPAGDAIRFLSRGAMPRINVPSRSLGGVASHGYVTVVYDMSPDTLALGVAYPSQPTPGLMIKRQGTRADVVPCVIEGLDVREVSVGQKTFSMQDRNLGALLDVNQL